MFTSQGEATSHAQQYRVIEIERILKELEEKVKFLENALSRWQMPAGFGGSGFPVPCVMRPTEDIGPQVGDVPGTGMGRIQDFDGTTLVNSTSYSEDVEFKNTTTFTLLTGFYFQYKIGYDGRRFIDAPPGCTAVEPGA